MVRESLEPGQSALVVALRNGINPNQLFHWRKLHQDGGLSAVSAGEAVAPASELADALKQIRELQRMLGKKAQHPVNMKRVYRVMRDHDLLLERRRKQPGVTRRQESRVAVDASSTRWCSEGFEFHCEDDEKLRVTFAPNCCDREAISWVASPHGYSGNDFRDVMQEAIEQRFSDELPTSPVQWLSDNGSLNLLRCVSFSFCERGTPLAFRTACVPAFSQLCSISESRAATGF